MSKMSLSKVIFRFTSQKGNLAHKLVTKTYDDKSSEVIEHDTMITEQQAKLMSTEYGIEIVDLVFDTETGKMKKA